MANEMVFDRRKGFVALPVEVLELDLSPGAFRLLVELCRMANLDGLCWPSLGQLGERLGRSRAAISGYVQDLREAELITTEEQRTANGYNYRLRYCVVFWRAWRASLTGRVQAADTDQKDESRVRQGERLRKLKNQSLINHDQSERTGFEDLIQSWTALAKGAPYPALRKAPAMTLVSESEAATKSVERPVISADISTRLDALWAALNLDPDPAAAKTAAADLAARDLSEADFGAVLEAIRLRWQAHWRRIPSPKHLDQILKSARFTPRLAQIKVLRSYLKRWDRVRDQMEKPLHAETACGTLHPMATGAPCPAPTTYIRGYN
ncbi:MAG: helix-turn-helix domain-containing protein [Pseudomonadota bacterium]